MAINVKCDPLNSNFDAPIGPPIPGMPGFSFDINFPTVPTDWLKGFPEDILNLLRRLKLRMPGGSILQETVDSLAKSISAILSKMLNYLNLFMGFYMMILAIVEMIVCIIKVLCAFPKPWSVFRAVKRLIRKCLPIFISIVFPYFALLLLLLALIELLIALIEYIINMIIRLIKQLIKNFLRLKAMVDSGRNANAALAAVAKMANLTCLFEQIFVFLGIIFAILELITSQWQKILKPCGGTNDGGPDDDSVCAEFMSDPVTRVDTELELYESRVTGTTGELLYCNEVYGYPIPGFASITKSRDEKVYLRDPSLATSLRFSNVIALSKFNKTFPMFPFDKLITKDTSRELTPYFTNVSFTCNPLDGFGTRAITVNDVTVTSVSTTANTDVNDSVVVPTTDATAFLHLSGGTVVNDVFLNGKTIEYVLGQRADAGGHWVPTQTGDGYAVSTTNVSHTLKINFDALFEYQLITFSCVPSMKVEQGILDTSFQKAFNFSLSDFVTVPDVGAAISSLEMCFSTFRTRINEETINTFGECMLAAIQTLSDQANTAYCQLLQTILDVYNMTCVLDTDLQFINNPIEISIEPRDNNGITFANIIGDFTPPQSCMDDLASKFSATVTLGTVSKFAYDGYGKFIAAINSTESGDGYASLFFDGNQIKTVVKPIDISTEPSITDTLLPYTYVGTSDGYNLPGIRRDETDTAGR